LLRNCCPAAENNGLGGWVGFLPDQHSAARNRTKVAGRPISFRAQRRPGGVPKRLGAPAGAQTSLTG